MTTNNNVNTTLVGQTGNGKFAGSDSPAFTTPDIGVANANSIDFGNGPLSDYIDNTAFSPSPIFTCATPGDLSVAYTTQNGFYVRIGNVIIYNLIINCIPTFTTASGQIQFGNLPFPPSQTKGDCLSPADNVLTLTYPVGTTQLAFQTLGAGGNLGLVAYGSGVVSANVTMANIVSGVGVSIQCSGFYFV